MDELVRLRDAVKPEESLLVLDGLTGQDAVKSRFSSKSSGGHRAVLTKRTETPGEAQLSRSQPSPADP